MRESGMCVSVLSLGQTVCWYLGQSLLRQMSAQLSKIKETHLVSRTFYYICAYPYDYVWPWCTHANKLIFFQNKIKRVVQRRCLLKHWDQSLDAGVKAVLNYRRLTGERKNRGHVSAGADNSLASASFYSRSSIIASCVQLLVIALWSRVRYRVQFRWS